MADLRCILLSFLVLISSASFAFSLEQPTCASIEDSKTKYFAQNQYNEFIEELNNFKNADKSVELCLDYYKALGRYQQLKYLEEKQSWDDYFANGNTYRQQIEENAKKVIDQALSLDPLKLKSMLLLWQYHRDQQDAFSEQALTDLMAQLNAYAKDGTDSELIKSAADKLLTYEEKSNARLAYKLYVNKLVESKSDPELKKAAAGFYKEGNLELAMGIYDIYIDRISKSLDKDKLVKELFEIASLFVYKPRGFSDMPYAEKVYSKIEEIGQKKVFNQEAIYLRALNLEKSKDYKQAGEFYSELIQGYPETAYYDEAIYKIAMINAYALANLAEARKHFGILTAKTVFSPQVIESFYQLGLLAQWEGDLENAKNSYSLLLKNAGDNYASITALAKDRLKEIEENKPINYNLKMFLDLSLKKDSALLEPNKLELKASGYTLAKNEKFAASSLVSMPQSGCNQVQLQYLWSGALGGASPDNDAVSFEGAYANAGTNEVNLVIVSPSGSIDRSFEMIDVY